MEKEFKIRGKKVSVGDYCCVMGCKNNRGADRRQGVVRSYYKFPSGSSEEAIKRRQFWVKWVECGRPAWKPRNWDVVCSDHFIGGAKNDVPYSMGYLPCIKHIINADAKAHGRSPNSGKIPIWKNSTPDDTVTMVTIPKSGSLKIQKTSSQRELLSRGGTKMGRPIKRKLQLDHENKVQLKGRPKKRKIAIKTETTENKKVESLQEKWYVNPNHGSKMLSHMSELWKEKKFCDASMKIGDVKIQVHKLILVAASPHLLAIAFGKSPEARLDLSLPSDTDVKSLHVILTYLYDGFLHLTIENLLSVEKIASVFQLSDILNYCSHFSELTKPAGNATSSVSIDSNTCVASREPEANTSGVEIIDKPYCETIHKRVRHGVLTHRIRPLKNTENLKGMFTKSLLKGSPVKPSTESSDGEASASASETTTPTSQTKKSSIRTPDKGASVSSSEKNTPTAQTKKTTNRSTSVKSTGTPDERASVSNSEKNTPTTQTKKTTDSFPNGSTSVKPSSRLNVSMAETLAAIAQITKSSNVQPNKDRLSNTGTGSPAKISETPADKKSSGATQLHGTAANQPKSTALAAVTPAPRYILVSNASNLGGNASTLSSPSPDKNSTLPTQSNSNTINKGVFRLEPTPSKGSRETQPSKIGSNVSGSRPLPVMKLVRCETDGSKMKIVKVRQPASSGRTTDLSPIAKNHSSRQATEMTGEKSNDFKDQQKADRLPRVASGAST